MFSYIKYLLASLLIILLLICLWHNLSNKFEEKNIVIPGDKIKIYNNEYIHSKKIGSGKYTIVLLPGMGTASPYYDFYKPPKSYLSQNIKILHYIHIPVVQSHQNYSSPVLSVML